MCSSVLRVFNFQRRVVKFCSFSDMEASLFFFRKWQSFSVRKDNFFSMVSAISLIPVCSLRIHSQFMGYRIFAIGQFLR